GRAYSGASRAQEAGRRHTPTGSAAYSTSVGVEALGIWTNTTPTAQVDVTESSREPAAGAVCPSAVRTENSDRSTTGPVLPLRHERNRIPWSSLPVSGAGAPFVLSGTGSRDITVTEPASVSTGDPRSTVRVLDPFGDRPRNSQNASPRTST